MIKTTVIVATYPGDPWVEKLKPHLDTSRYNVLFPGEAVKRNFAQNNNLGARLAETPYICFLNSDTIPQPDFVEQMEKMLDSNPQFGIVGAKLYFPEDVEKNIQFKGRILKVRGQKNRVQHAGIQFNEHLMPYEYGRNMPQNHPDVTQPFFSAAVTGACMMVRRDEFFVMGGFDVRFENGWEDVDLGLRYYEKKMLSVYQPKAVVGHYYGGAEEAGRFKCEDKNFDHWYEKWHRTGRIHKIFGAKHTKVDFGCGNVKKDGFVGVDKYQGRDVDLLFDMNSISSRGAWIPFKPGEVDEIYCARVLEYANDISWILNDFHRILRPFGILEVIVPHALSKRVFADPQLKRGFVPELFTEYLDHSHREELLKKDLSKHNILPWVIDEVKYLNEDSTKKPQEYDLEIYARMRPFQ